jgi:hypothetical protein
MEIVLIRDGVVVNVISADSLERARQFYPDCDCREKAGVLEAVSPGARSEDGGKTWTNPPAPDAPAPHRWITPDAFTSRIAQMEVAMIELASTDNPNASQAQRLAAAGLRATVRRLSQVQYVDLGRRDPQSAYALLMALEQMGLIGAGRALEIVEAPVQDGELSPLAREPM